MLRRERQKSNETETAVLKIVVIGDLGVGKTLLVNTFVHRGDAEEITKSNQFSNSYKSIRRKTGYVNKNTTYLSTDDRRVRMDIWDTAGLETEQGSTCKLDKVTEFTKSQKQQNIDFIQSVSTGDSDIYAIKGKIIGTETIAAHSKQVVQKETGKARVQKQNKLIQPSYVRFQDYKVKIILLGESGVGKTTMVQTFDDICNKPCDRIEKESPHNRRHVRTSEKRVPDKAFYNSIIKRDHGKVHMTVCDTAGQERYRSLTSSYYRGTHGCLILFDVRKSHTFDSVQSWYNDLTAYCTSPDKISVILIGTHSNAEDREVPKDKAEKWAEHIGIPYMEISDDDHHTVLEVFQKLADMIIDIYKHCPPLETESTSTRLSKRTHKQHTWCSC